MKGFQLLLFIVGQEQRVLLKARHVWSWTLIDPLKSRTKTTCACKSDASNHRRGLDNQQFFDMLKKYWLYRGNGGNVIEVSVVSVNHAMAEAWQGALSHLIKNVPRWSKWSKRYRLSINSAKIQSWSNLGIVEKNLEPHHECWMKR